MHIRGKHTSRAIVTALFLAIPFLVFTGCSDDPEAGGQKVSIDSVTPATAGAGDVVTIEGSGFDPDPSKNRVVFSAYGITSPGAGRIAVPAGATGTSLSVEVPEGSFSGGVRIDKPFPDSGGPFDAPLPSIPSNSLDFDVQLSQGDVAKIFYGGTGYDMPLSTGVAGEDYILILFNSAAPPEAGMGANYTVDNDTPCLSPAVAEADQPVEEPREGGMLLMAGAGDLVRSFERRKREEVLSLLNGRSGSVSDDPGLDGRQFSPLSPQAQNFFVLNDAYGSTINPDNFTLVTADLKYEGTHTLLYVDQSTHFSCITDSEAEALGLEFESNIYPTNTSTFGSESDINNDDKVVILLTPVVNELTSPGGATSGFIAGFFLPGDLLPGYVPSGTTNGMEIYYSFVPDPNGVYGNIYEKTRALEVIKGVIAHEFQHMIMFNYRVLNYGDGYKLDYMADLWVDEGLAHIAEDVNGFDESNIRRADLFMNNTGDVSLTQGGDELTERGASFLFFRYLGDRFGEQIFSEIVQTTKIGRANIEQATGLTFKEIFTDWAATMYFESEGITPSDPKYSYSSLDLPADFMPLTVRNGNICGSPLMGEIQTYGPEFILMEFTGADVYDLNISSALYGSMNAALIRIQ